MPKKIKKLSKKFIAFVCMITLVFSFSVTVKKADATLASVKDTMSDSRFSTASNHTVSFQVKQGELTTGDTIVVAFEEDFTTTSMVFADIGVSDGAAVTLKDGACAAETDTVGVTNEGSDTVTFTLCNSTTIADEAAVTITFSNLHITNPAAATCGGSNNSYVCDIDITTTGTNGEAGRTQVAIISGVTVSATVNAVMTFTINDTSVGFGGIDPGVLRYATADASGAASAPGAGDPFALTLVSNIAGASITIKSLNGAGTAGLYSTLGSHTLTAVSADTIDNDASADGFAIYGAATGMTMDAGFVATTGNVAVSNANQTFATASSLGTNTVQVDLIAASDAASPAQSDYATTLIFVATPTY